jgi:F-type H+-transporting ATPase subunit b
MPQFDITSYSSQMFWLVVVFGFLYFAVYKLLTPKAEQIFKNRQDTLEGNINDATNLSKKAELLKESYNAGLKDIREVAENIRKDSVTSLDSSFVQKKLELTKELAIASEKTSEEVNQSVQLFRINEPSACVSLAEFVIEKLTNKKADLELLKKCYGKN